MSIHLILYSKPGCHLCEGLQAKLVQIESLDLVLDVRDITTRDDWFQAYQYEIPVLVLVRGEGVESRESGVRIGVEKEAGEAEEAGEAIQNSKLHPSSFILHPSSHRKAEASYIPLPRPSPRATVQQLEQMLRQCLSEIEG